uniref:hypothetical protein n=1 Tax=Stappia sp. TaxID=1870903 RepID=UPI003BA88B76
MRKLIPLSAVLALALLASAPFPAAAADERCQVPEAGRWINRNADYQEIRILEIESHCRGKQIVMRMRAFTRCSPRDCKWGWTDAWRNASGRVEASFPGLFGAREIQVITMEKRIEALVTYRPHDRSNAAEFHAAIMVRD